MTPRAVLPSSDGVVGTSRQPRTRRPSSAASASTDARAAASAASSSGRNAVPTAYAPLSGSGNGVTPRRNASGTWVRMPAPSPESGSAPEAPRWSRLRSAVSAWSTISWVATPDRVATKATPQASCSYAGS